MRRELADLMVVKENGTSGIRTIDPTDHIEKSRFSRSIRSDQTMNGTFFNVNIDILKCLHPAETFAQTFGSSRAT